MAARFLVVIHDDPTLPVPGFYLDAHLYK